MKTREEWQETFVSPAAVQRRLGGRGPRLALVAKRLVVAGFEQEARGRTTGVPWRGEPAPPVTA